MIRSHSTGEIRETLEREISGALDADWEIIRVEVKNIKAENNTYSTSGSYKIIPFFGGTLKHKGTFNIDLDENLNVISFEIEEETQ